MPDRATPAPQGSDAAGDPLQAALAQLCSILVDRGDLTPQDPPSARTLSASRFREQLLALAEAEYDCRRHRDALFGPQLFGEPAWDMLLYLYIAELRHEEVATSSLARASLVPTTTALRWMAHLEREGLIVSRSTERDGRVRAQHLTRRASTALERYFATRLRARPAQRDAGQPDAQARP